MKLCAYAGKCVKALAFRQKHGKHMRGLCCMLGKGASSAFLRQQHVSRHSKPYIGMLCTGCTSVLYLKPLLTATRQMYPPPLTERNGRISLNSGCLRKKEHQEHGVQWLHLQKFPVEFVKGN